MADANSDDPVTPGAAIANSSDATPGSAVTNGSEVTALNAVGGSVSNVTTTYTGPYAASKWGAMGEQDMGFYLGQLGIDLLLGPGGAAGKPDNAHGPDGLGITAKSPDGLPIHLLDNKTTGLPTEINECSAFTEKPADKFSALLKQTRNLDDFPHKQNVLDTLQNLVDAVTAHDQGQLGRHVPDVEFDLVNAGGYARGPSDKLQSDFHAATGLLDAKGNPLKLGFMDTVPPSMLADRQAQIAARMSLYNPAGNPRGLSENPVAEVRKPVLLEPATFALGGVGPDTSGIGALNGLLEAIKLVGEVALPFIPTTAQRELAAKWPEITKPLAEHPDQGVLLVRRSWLPAINMNDYGDTSSRAVGPQAYFRDWRWQHAPTANDAYAWYNPPGSALRSLGPYGEVPVEDYFWVDSSGKWTPYPPPSLQT